jgi:hypothetical protein
MLRHARAHRQKPPSCGQPCVIRAAHARFRTVLREWLNSIELTHALSRFALTQFTLHQGASGDLEFRVAGARGEDDAIRAALLSLFGPAQPLAMESDARFEDTVVQYTSAIAEALRRGSRLLRPPGTTLGTFVPATATPPVSAPRFASALAATASHAIVAPAASSSRITSRAAAIIPTARRPFQAPHWDPTRNVAGPIPSELPLLLHGAWTTCRRTACGSWRTPGRAQRRARRSVPHTPGPARRAPSRSCRTAA